MKALTKSEHNKLAEKVLKHILSEHFFSSGLEWAYNEGVNLKENDPEIYAKIALLYPEMTTDKE